jgi:bifunctional non-homologous end joining protein LigD
MPIRQFEPCIPACGTAVPTGADWIHEIKHDGYRLIVHRQDKAVRLFTRNGHDWTDRYPWIAQAALQNRQSSVLDGEAVTVQASFPIHQAAGDRPNMQLRPSLEQGRSSSCVCRLR